MTEIGKAARQDDVAVSQDTNAPRIAVIVPTNRRPHELERCLAALTTQSRPADEIVVVYDHSDAATAAVLRSSMDPCVWPLAEEASFVKRIRAGAEATSAELLVLVDDDIVPPADWLGKLEARLADDVGAVGGRDLIHGLHGEQPTPTYDVGRITSWGRVVGNHHLGTGPARDVALLKGCNMIFRREAWGMPHGLQGEATQELHTEVAFCMWARRLGWRLVYDPEIVVDHYPAFRLGAGRPGASFEDRRAAAYNLVACLLIGQPSFFWRRALFRLLVGDAAHPGVARGLLGLVRREREVARSILPSLLGQSQALVDFVRGRRVSIHPLTATVPAEARTVG